MAGSAHGLGLMRIRPTALLLHHQQHAHTCRCWHAHKLRRKVCTCGGVCTAPHLLSSNLHHRV
jgi:hypothetical protein